MWDDEKILSSTLAVARILIGVMLLWAFFDKLIGLNGPTPSGMGIIDGGSPTKDYLLYSDGWLSGFFNWLGQFYVICDVLIMVGLLGIGICFTIGIVKKFSLISFCVLMFLFWLSVLPSPDMPLVDYHLIYIAAGIAVYYGKGFERWSLEDQWKTMWLPRNYAFFE